MYNFPKGVLPILATPFTKEGAVDYESLKNLTRWLIERKVGAITMFGFASEFHKLSDFERNEMIDVVIKEANKQTPIIVSVTKHSTELAVRCNLCRKARRRYVDASSAFHYSSISIYVYQPYRKCLSSS